jgi:hypothetical protein
VKRCFLILVGLLIGGLLASAQCYTDCAIAAASATEAGAMAHCHEHSRNHGQPENACPHHHFRLSSPESGTHLATRTEAKIFPFPAASVSPQLISFVPTHERWINADPAPPPKQSAFLSRSILRI